MALPSYYQNTSAFQIDTPHLFSLTSIDILGTAEHILNLSFAKIPDKLPEIASSGLDLDLFIDE